MLSLVVFLSFLSAWHKTDFSTPQTNVNKQYETLSQWRLIHLLGGECKCSEYITDYLVSRKPQANVLEKIVIFDDLKMFAPRLKRAGYEVEVQDYSQMKIEDAPVGIPLLLVVSPAGRVVYEGGYSDQMINPTTEFQDLNKLKDATNNREVASLPAYGCAISKKYKKWLDPMGLKYGSINE